MPHWRLVLGAEVVIAAITAALGVWGLSVLFLLGAASTMAAARRRDAPPSLRFQFAVMVLLMSCGLLALAFTVAGVLRRDALTIVLLCVMVLASLGGVRNLRRNPVYVTVSGESSSGARE